MATLLTADPPPGLAGYVDAGVISADDVAAVGVLVSLASRDGPLEPEPLAWLALALALRTPRDGHTCVDLARIADWSGDDLVEAVKGIMPGSPVARRLRLRAYLSLIRANLQLSTRVRDVLER
jgi:hypothetical protein